VIRTMTYGTFVDALISDLMASCGENLAHLCTPLRGAVGFLPIHYDSKGK